ncbi:TetR/AcrR family transcriptional regulator [Sphingomonas sp.]|jgi:AcrR family transcriptional regulator|uniref:TetR/AcrR family transcriptional regulator n=1 Tax=Sphingomonas sp. TaxID=28214 RepID=UPI002E34391C|nr:TetR/AcrR family transcriptional regulator [Sphingomonas sp.]HEX4694078.1 TetR/AcrR family transcriptional regulator [Sphingomonas sp.]
MRQSDAQQDGRRRRSQTSRDKIVAAMLELVAEGRITPSAEEVAARAKVGLRTVFRHFADMESLYAALTHTLAEQYEMWLIPFESSHWREQLIEVIERRTATYERLLPFKCAGDAHRHMSPSMQNQYARVLGIMRQRLHSFLPRSIVEDPTRFELIDLMLSFEVWQRLRGEQQLESDQAHRIVSAEILRLAEES